MVRPLKEFGSPVLDLCEPKPYLAHQAMFDPSFPHGRWYYMRACDVAELTDEVIDITVEHSMRIRSPLTTFPIWQMGGAVARVGEDDTAFNGRGAGHTFNITGSTETAEGFDEEREWARSFWSALEPHHTERLRELPHGRGRGAGPRGVRGGEVRPAEGAEAPLRPGQPLPAQPEHFSYLAAPDDGLISVSAPNAPARPRHGPRGSRIDAICLRRPRRLGSALVRSACTRYAVGQPLSAASREPPATLALLRGG